MPTYLKASSKVTKALKALPVDLQEHFTDGTPCQVCGTPVGQSASVVVAEAKTMLLVVLTHTHCSSSLHRRVDVLPLSAESEYEYRTVILPVTVQGDNYLLPVLLARTQVDKIVATRQGATWKIEDGADLTQHGYGPVQDSFPQAQGTTVEVDPNHKGLSVTLPDQQEINVRDERFVQTALETGALLVSVQRTGSPTQIEDVPALMRLLQGDEALTGVVAVTDSDENAEDVTPSDTEEESGNVTVKEEKEG